MFSSNLDRSAVHGFINSPYVCGAWFITKLIIDKTMRPGPGRGRARQLVRYMVLSMTSLLIKPCTANKGGIDKTMYRKPVERPNSPSLDLQVQVDKTMYRIPLETRKLIKPCTARPHSIRAHALLRPSFSHSLALGVRLA